MNHEGGHIAVNLVFRSFLVLFANYLTTINNLSFNENFKNLTSEGVLGFWGFGVLGFRV